MLCGKGERPGLGGGPHQRPMGPPPPHSEPRIRCRGRGGSCAQPLAKRDFRLFTAGRPRCRAPTIPGGLAKGLGGGSAGPCCTPWMGDTAASRWARLCLRPRGLHPLLTHMQAGGGGSVRPQFSAPLPEDLCAPGRLHPSCTPLVSHQHPRPVPVPVPPEHPRGAHPQVLSQPPTPPRCEQGVLRAPPPAPQFWLQRPHGIFHPPQPPARVPQMSASIGGGPQQGPPQSFTP